ncbi:uncharacterized protein An16g03570 [Aspergillus niger]|uniref:Contig An16c0130, genomic contig n=2 Tax=Aspergillus niger TaxID=5061 RepID=A2R7H7_ASPNC|nr:uncharacterized protein An16g03570 [Aspergillus niger]CAK42855.1 unnamed protein product [Aspergillus niger]
MRTIRAVVAKFMSLTTTDHLEQSKRVQRRNADVPKTPLSDVWEGCSCRGERAIGASSVHGLTWRAAKIGGGNNSESERDGGVVEEIKEMGCGRRKDAGRMQRKINQGNLPRKQVTNQQGEGIGMTNAVGYQSGKLTMGEGDYDDDSRTKRGGVGFRDLQRTGWRAKQRGGERKGKKGTEHRVAQRLNGLHEGPLSTQAAPETQ